MKIAIIHKEESFSEEWIAYCQKNKIQYKTVEVYRNDIMAQVDDCDIVMYPIYQNDYRDMQFAKSLLLSLEKRGKKVFPNHNTNWHFDDKIAQKYLLEAIDAPLVPTYVFYTKEEALSWAAQTDFPKVFKLKGGAGSSNVRLAKTRKEAIRLINQAFGKGFRQIRLKETIKETYRKYKIGKATIKDILRPVYHTLTKKYPSAYEHYHGKEIGYAYFQDFIPNNSYDTRICVVGNRAFGLIRYTRNDDFRASGSGFISYEKDKIDERCVETAFALNKKLKMQSAAFDFVEDCTQTPVLLEISYGFVKDSYKECEGYWTEDMVWHPGSNFDFCGWMVEDLLKE